VPARADGGRGWVDDFVNHLAKSDAQRNPNSGLRLHLDVAPRLTKGVSAAERG
jgi:hypothetical protein